jgi:demethylmenaquinone methyltransferase/2-methoxy-6-polyprenyl-1,4-benzoquinol methylase
VDRTAFVADGTYEAFYDGRLYSLVFDPLLRPLHELVATWVAPDSACLDVCCGTGALTTHLAARCRQVDGVDLSARMVAHAERVRRHRGLDNVSYRVGDATNLRAEDHAYDFATISMALHEMPADVRSRVLPEVLRVARTVVVVDFAIPMPRNLQGLRNRFIELMNGPRHFRGFRDFTRRGGLPTLIAAAGAHVERDKKIDRRTLQLVELRTR